MTDAILDDWLVGISVSFGSLTGTQRIADVARSVVRRDA
jgi:hypothetical protein